MGWLRCYIHRQTELGGAQTPTMTCLVVPTEWYLILNPCWFQAAEHPCTLSVWPVSIANWSNRLNLFASRVLYHSNSQLTTSAHRLSLSLSDSPGTHVIEASHRTVHAHLHQRKSL